jgi:hypothetical protein
MPSSKARIMEVNNDPRPVRPDASLRITVEEAVRGFLSDSDEEARIWTSFLCFGQPDRLAINSTACVVLSIHSVI